MPSRRKVKKWLRKHHGVEDWFMDEDCQLWVTFTSILNRNTQNITKWPKSDIRKLWAKENKRRRRFNLPELEITYYE